MKNKKQPSTLFPWSSAGLLALFIWVTSTTQAFARTDLPSWSDLKISTGLIEISGAPICGAFVSSPNEVTTASHCINMLQPEDMSQISFVNRLGQRGYYEAIVRNDRSKDIAVLRMKGIENLPALGMSLPQNGVETSALAWTTGERNQLAPVEVKDLQIGVDGLLRYDLQSQKIASGSPVLQSGNVVGVHSGVDRGTQSLGGFGVPVIETSSLLQLDELFANGKLQPASDVACVAKVLGLIVLTQACIAGIGGLSAACVVVPPACAALGVTAALCGVSIGSLAYAVIHCS